MRGQCLGGFHGQRSSPAPELALELGDASRRQRLYGASAIAAVFCYLFVVCSDSIFGWAPSLHLASSHAAASSRHAALVTGQRGTSGLESNELDPYHVEVGLERGSLARRRGTKALEDGSSIDGDRRAFEEYTPSEDVLLYIGVLSGMMNRHKREAVRDAWCREANETPGVMCRFMLSTDEQSEIVLQEQEANGDIVFVESPLSYKSILWKVFGILKDAVQYRPSLIMKADDDTFVNVPLLIKVMRLVCSSPNCVRDQLYVGQIAKNTTVITAPRHKWANVPFRDQTMVDRYTAYMFGGGYVVSGRTAAALVAANRVSPLFFTSIEDATFGHWVSALQIQRVDTGSFVAFGVSCCFARVAKPKNGEPDPVPPELAAQVGHYLVLRHPCETDTLRLVLHKVVFTRHMRYLGMRARECRDNTTAVLDAGGVSALDLVWGTARSGLQQQVLEDPEGEPDNGSGGLHDDHGLALRSATAMDATLAPAA